jgi:hypothetical protein
MPVSQASILIIGLRLGKKFKGKMKGFIFPSKPPSQSYQAIKSFNINLRAVSGLNREGSERKREFWRRAS